MYFCICIVMLGHEFRRLLVQNVIFSFDSLNLAIFAEKWKQNNKQM